MDTHVIEGKLNELQSMVSAYRSKPTEFVSFDIETGGLSPYYSPIAALQFMQGEKRSTIVDMRGVPKEDYPFWGAALEPLFDGTIEVVGQNIKFDLEFLEAQLHVSAYKVYDTMIAEQVVWGLGISAGKLVGISFDMHSIAERYGLEVSKEERSWFIDLHTRKEWNEPFPQEQIRYMDQDVRVLAPIKERQGVKIARFGLQHIIELEMRSLLSVVSMELNGVHIDIEKWREVLARTQEEVTLQEEHVVALLTPHILRHREAEFMVRWGPWAEWRGRRDAELIHEKEQFVHTKQTGWGTRRNEIMAYYREIEPLKPHADTSLINMNSSHQVKDALNEMRLCVKEGDEPIIFDSVSSDALVMYGEQFLIIADILELRKGQKLLQAFGENLLQKIDERTARLYATYNQIGADTGRMSSYNPNFQQIPGSGIGAMLRHCVAAQEGHSFVVADFSNVEMRILADQSGDPAMLRMFASGLDLHGETAKTMFNLAANFDVTTDAVINGRVMRNLSWRKIAKTINFGLVYGMSAQKLARTLRIDVETAKALMERYFETYAGVKRWLDAQRGKLNTALDRGAKMCQSRTVGGRVRWYRIPQEPPFPATSDRQSLLDYQQAKDEYRSTLSGIRRKLANSPIQGTSADITKLAMALWYERVGYGEDLKLVAVVHDELIVECVKGCEAEAETYLQECMGQAQAYYLKRVTLPAIKCVVSEHWEH